MTPLRMKMIEDMRLVGLAASTQAVYLQGVRALAAHYRRSPDLLTEVEVRNYLLHLRERGVALGTFKPHHGGIQFLYRQTLDREWSLFSKKEFGRGGWDKASDYCDGSAKDCAVRRGQAWGAKLDALCYPCR
jgi:Phage integrase, N-terminal SAM-like domain